MKYGYQIDQSRKILEEVFDAWNNLGSNKTISSAKPHYVQVILEEQLAEA